MKKIFALSTAFALAMAFTACSSSDDTTTDSISTQTSGIIGTQAMVDAACTEWKESRQDWEWSEAFLFGAAGDYAIDPHTDTWPFDKTMFNNYMAKYNPSSNADDATILTEAIATGQNLTGFHAVEYLIFRDGEARKVSDITPDELWFAQTAAQDLYLASLKLVSAWGGQVTEAEQAMLDDADFESSKNYGEDFKNAGEKGSGYSSIVLATKQIISGAQDIIGEMHDSKIGSPATGADVNYIESPHAYNSIQDFYDNIMSCKHALYGGWTVTGDPTESSLIGICLRIDRIKDKASAVCEALTTALEKISAMKKPFVKYYTDQSAKDAMSALNDLDDALTYLDAAIDEYGDDNEILNGYFKTVNENYVDYTVIPTYRALADNNKSLVEALNKLTWKK